MVVGGVVAQLLSFVIERQRWRRDDNVRRQVWAREDAVQQREALRELYEELLRNLERLAFAVRRSEAALRVGSPSIQEPALDSLLSMGEEVANLSARMRTHAPSPSFNRFIELMEAAFRVVGAASGEMSKIEVASAKDEDVPQVDADVVVDQIAELLDAIREMQESARRDLGHHGSVSESRSVFPL